MTGAISTEEFSTLIRTKLNLPRIADDLIDRPRLIERLNESLTRKVTLVSAPAGYGKTTLVGQWLSGSRFGIADFRLNSTQEREIQNRKSQIANQVAWLSLSERDNDLLLFLSYIVAAVETIYLDGCPETSSLLEATQLPPVTYIASTLINEIATLPSTPIPQAGPSFLLVLDDYHLVTEPAIHELLKLVIEHQPEQMHLVLVSRFDPLQLPITQLRAQQQIVEIRRADLRFDRAETQAFLAQMLGVRLSEDLVAALDNWFEGWVVGLRLASISMRDMDDPTAFVQALKGTDRYVMEYLVDEVISHQPPAIQSFLLRISILDRFCGSLCETVVGIDDPECNGRAYLEWLDHTNLFVVALDNRGEWYRYHHLFRDLLADKLQTELSAAELAGLHRTAGQWFAAHGYLEEAIQHSLLANDVGTAIQLVEDNSHNLLNRLERHTLERWLSMLPEELIWQRPRLLIARAWLMYRQARLTALDTVLDKAETCLNLDGEEALTSAERQAMSGQINALRSVTAHMVYRDFGCSLASAELALQQLPPTEYGAYGTATGFAALAEQATGHKEKAIGRLEEILHDPTPVGPAKIQAFIGLSFVHLIAGDLPQMSSVVQQFLGFAAENKNANAIVGSSWVAGLLHYEWNELTVAKAHLTKAAELRFSSNYIASFNSILALARIDQVLGNLDQAQDTLDTLRAEVMKLQNKELLSPLDSFQADLWQRQGDVTQAVRWARSVQSANLAEPIFLFELPTLTRARILTAHSTESEVQDVVRDLQESLKTIRARHHTQRMVNLLARLALAYDRLGQAPEALASLRQALTLGYPGGFIRTFVDCGPAQIPLLQQLQQQGVAPDYVAQLLTAFPSDRRLPIADRRQADNKTPLDLLTRREEEILRLMQAGLTNQDIANELVISLYTVKRHATNIYNKLTVSNRRQAIRKAQQLGLLSENRD